MPPRHSSTSAIARTATIFTLTRAHATENQAPLYVAPQLAVGGEHTWVRRIPERVRSVHAYARPEDGAVLPDHTRVLFAVPGVGLSLLTPPLGMELAALLSFRTAGDGDRRTLEEIATGGDDYVGYVIRSTSLDLTLRRRVIRGLWLGAGWRAEFGRLESGADAYSSFHREHVASLPGAVLVTASVGNFVSEGSFGGVGFMDLGASVSPSVENRVISVYLLFRGGLLLAPWHEDRAPP